MVYGGLTEINEYTNGEDANKIGLVEDEETISLIRSLLEEHKIYYDMMVETHEILEWIKKVTEGHFDIKHVKASPQYYSEYSISYRLILDEQSYMQGSYDFHNRALDSCHIHVGKSYFNISRIISNEIKEKMVSAIENFLENQPYFDRERGFKITTTVIRIYGNDHIDGYIEGLGKIFVNGEKLSQEVKKGDVLEGYARNARFFC